MKYITIILLFFLLIISNACGFKKVNSKELNNFDIIELKIIGENRLAYKLKNDLKNFSNKNSNIKFDIIINISSSKISKIKDSTGKTTRYTANITANVLIKNIQNLQTNEKKFYTENDFAVSNNQSETINNEKNAIKNNLNTISQEIIKHIKILNLN